MHYILLKGRTVIILMIKRPILHNNHWDIKTPFQGNCWDIKNPCQGNYWDIKTPCQGNYWDKKKPYQGNYWDIETPYMGYDWDILVPCMGLVAFSQSGKFTLKTQRNPSNIPFFYQIGNYQKFPVSHTMRSPTTGAKCLLHAFLMWCNVTSSCLKGTNSRAPMQLYFCALPDTSGLNLWITISSFCKMSWEGAFRLPARFSFIAFLKFFHDAISMLGQPLPFPSPCAKSTSQSMLGYYGRHRPRKFLLYFTFSFISILKCFCSTFTLTLTLHLFIFFFSLSIGLAQNFLLISFWISFCFRL